MAISVIVKIHINKMELHFKNAQKGFVFYDKLIKYFRNK